MIRSSLGLITITLLLIAPASTRADDAPARADVVLKGGELIDGTGAERRRADVAIRGDRIIAVGDLEDLPRDRTIDASSLIVAPGFIDLHTHSDSGIVADATRLNLNYLTQGVTTIVTGNCGSGPIDVRAYFAKIDARGAGTNVIHQVPHGSLRRSVMGNADREPTADELDRMRNLMRTGMEGGAWGMSTGLIYLPGRYARTPELIELAKVVNEFGGHYASHIRGEGTTVLKSIDEAISIGEGSGVPVHVSHLKTSGRASWGKSAQALEKIAEARAKGQIVTADQYPYIASSTSLSAMVIPPWALNDGVKGFAKIADDPKQGRKLRTEIERNLGGRNGGGAIQIASYPPRPERVGKRLDAIAREEGITVVDLIIDIQRHGGAPAISFGMDEPDVRAIMKADFVATASDGGARSINEKTQPHPRSFGTFPRKIRYAEDEHVITLEHAVRSSSGLPASILGLPDRGTIRPGAFADIVVFDPKTFRDLATFEKPMVYAEGARYVFVNGVALIADGKLPDQPSPGKKLPGRALRLKKDGAADVVVLAGRIWTGDPANPRAEALAARDGVIVAVGSREEVLHWKGPKTRVIDEPGALATPGLIDAHAHIDMLGETLEQLDLRGVKSPEEVARLAKERAKSLPADAWIVGGNWDQSLWPGGEFPDARTLDEAVSDRPVWLRRIDGHAAWANSEALRRAGIDKDTKAPADGQIHRDADGRPTGVFIDGAMNLIDRKVPRPTKADVERRILAAQKELLSLGLTGAHDAGVTGLDAEVFRDLDRAGKLTLRVYGMLSPPAGREVETVSRPPVETVEGGRFQLRAIKLFIDGALGSRGALLFEPYSDDPGNSGLLLIDPKVLEDTTRAALKNGWQVAVHAIGDKGNALVLDAFAAALQSASEAHDPRLRIEHAQVVRKQDVQRFVDLGLIASMQPAHASSDMRWADARLGPDRAEGAYALRWFLDAGVPLAFGSDFPVEIANPLWEIYAALTRQDADGKPEGGWHPDQRLSLDETLRAFTAGSAFAGFAEDRLGVLKPGLRADLTIFDRDLFEEPPARVLSAKVRKTIIDGAVVFDADAP